MVRGRHMKESVVSVTCAPAVEAIEANIEAGGVILGASLAEAALQSSREAHTIESKHWVQSSRYTACAGPGRRSSALRQYCGSHLEASAGHSPGALTCVQNIAGCCRPGVSVCRGNSVAGAQRRELERGGSLCRLFVRCKIPELVGYHATRVLVASGVTSLQTDLHMATTNN
jgi:hypothetical protein